MNNGFPIFQIIYQWIKPASFGSGRVDYTTLVSEKNASTITVFQMTLSFSFHDEIFEPVSLLRDSLNVKTREGHSCLYAAFDAAVNHAWDVAAQEQSPGFILLF